VKDFLKKPGVSFVLTVVSAILIALCVQAFFVKPYKIPSGSMEPTLEVGERILVNRLLYKTQAPQPGDMIVFHPPQGAEAGAGCAEILSPTKACAEAVDQRSPVTFVKRIVAGPGDTVAIEDGQPIVNGQPQIGDFDKGCDNQQGRCDLPDQIEVPKDHYFVLGDNRGHSLDSRFWGPVPKDWIVGKAFSSYWPPDRIGTL
jgi:signal peptidase I